MISFLNWLARRRFPYEPLIKVNISKNRLLHNLREFMKLAPNGQVAPVLKSNAYGHGLFEVARTLEHSGISIPFFIVDSYFEAVALRSRGIKTPLLIIGYTRPETITHSKLKRTAFTVTSIETLKEIGRPRHPINIHIKIDTGMRRQGLLPDEIDEAINIIKENPSLRLEGLCSHLSDADNGRFWTETQIGVWHHALRKFRRVFPNIKYTHLAATDGHRFGAEIDANITRLGIGLYGLVDGSKFTPKLDLLPVMEMSTLITGIKKLHPGETVGYGNTFKAEKNMTIATIPVGYFEGIDRRLSNSGTILVGSDRVPCPIVGRVSMNITTIDVSKVKNASIGMPVTVISNETRDLNSIQSMAEKYDEITYEIAVEIPSHLKRVVVD